MGWVVLLIPTNLLIYQQYIKRTHNVPYTSLTSSTSHQTVYDTLF